MQSAGDDSFSLTLAPLVETINKQTLIWLHMSLHYYYYYHHYHYYYF